MKTKQVFTCNDLGGGDGGKGGVVHKVCCEKKAHTVIKVGGAQGSHGVRTSRGESFNFSQFGCGTFEGIRTHLTRNFLVEPVGLLSEGNFLINGNRISNAFDLLTIDEDALCITPFHAAASQLQEMARKDNPKGTVGIGGGEAVRDAELYPELAIRVGDLRKKDVRDKLEAVRRQKLAGLQEIISRVEELWEDDQVIAHEQIALLHNDRFLDLIADHYNDLSSKVSIVDKDYLRGEILAKDGVVVVESSHGILTDRYHGFHPHTTQLRTLPQNTVDLLRECDYDGQIVKLGISRAYQIRHGAGPMVTELSDWSDKLLPDSNKQENRWQGKARVGPLDLVALRYAIEVCGGPQAFDGLAITWFDQIPVFGKWDVCDRYVGATNQAFFSPEGEILVRRGADLDQLEHQRLLGLEFRKCQPEITSFDIPPEIGKDDMAGLCVGVLGEKLGVSVRMISFGPTESDKVCL